MLKTRTQLLLVIAGITIGVAGTLLFQLSQTTALGAPERAMYQILNAGTATAVVWRINTVTGGLELCFARAFTA